MNTWTADLGSRKLTASAEELSKFRRLYVPDPTLAARMSELFVFDMYVLGKAVGIRPFEILEAVRHLETGEPPGGIKRASMFGHPPLKGFWHKHYFSAPFLPKNILLGLGKNGLQRLGDEVLDPSVSSVITEDMIKKLARRVTHEPIETRYRQGKLTGEWIIFAKHAGMHYYLCLGTHDDGDNAISERIMTHCVRDFPDLPRWKDEQASPATNPDSPPSNNQ